MFIDNGTGIKDSEKDKIFDEHFTTKNQGMGLGLSLAKRFMTSVNGEIDLKNSVPGESTFELKFPGRILQIRVKPMNVFTTPAVKINCSTKDLI